MRKVEHPCKPSISFEDMLGNWPRFFKVEGGWVGLSRVITGGAQLNGLVGWQGLNLCQPQQPSLGLC